MTGKNPSPEFAAGLLTAMDRTCPVCAAPPKVDCTSKLLLRATGLPMALAGPHFERVLPDWVDGA